MTVDLPQSQTPMLLVFMADKRKSRAQYERQFDNWEDRKNLSASDWRRVFLYMDQNGLIFEKNEDGGKRCIVLKNGKHINPPVLRRKRRDYCKGHGLVRSWGGRGKHLKFYSAKHD